MIITTVCFSGTPCDGPFVKHDLRCFGTCCRNLCVQPGLCVSTHVVANRRSSGNCISPGKQPFPDTQSSPTGSPPSTDNPVLDKQPPLNTQHHFDNQAFPDTLSFSDMSMSPGMRTPSANIRQMLATRHSSAPGGFCPAQVLHGSRSAWIGSRRDLRRGVALGFIIFVSLLATATSARWFRVARVARYGDHFHKVLFVTGRGAC